MRLFPLILIFAVAVSAMPAAGQDMRSALKAYKRGDYETALRTWRPLAEGGHPGAQYNLGFNYLQGKGVPKDIVLAYFWFDLAARQGRAIAQQLRDGVSRRMTPEQIADAQARVQKWLAAHPEQAQ